MSVILVLIGASLLLALGFLCAFFGAVRRGQFDDVETPALRILIDEDTKPCEGNDHDRRRTDPA